ncbi:MAG: hypothetical protein ABI346_08565 [Candidatus Baltobacteraceae bacterium]
MNDSMGAFAPALDVANAVLYEGYLLYPYTASAGKNRIRWQFGVVVPREYAARGNGEACEQQTEILFERVAGEQNGRSSGVQAVLRFLQVESRALEGWFDGAFVPVPSLRVGGTTYLTFDEAVEREVHVALRLDAGAALLPIAIEGGRDVEELHDDVGEIRGRIVRRRWPLKGKLEIAFEPTTLSNGLLKLRVSVANESEVVEGERSSALRTALVSTHVLLAAQGGTFLSALDPPDEARAATDALSNHHVWPVLIAAAGSDAQRSALALASPIILYDFPAVAARTTDQHDGTEIDELLTLSVLALSDAEREEARATDPRARAIVERAESLDAQALARVHAGTLYRLDGTETEFDPFAALDAPALDCVIVGGVAVRKGSSVRLHPKRRADVWDTFLAEKIATVRAIHQDLEDEFYVAVTVDDDPASDLHDWYGRSLFFYPDEVEPLE